MKEGRMTAIIKSATVGRVDHYSDLMLSCTFDMNGSGTGLIFTMKQAKQMMEDVGIYDDVLSLVGKPCEIYVDEKNTCHFQEMWKQ